MASRRVECDQVVLAWSSANLLGGSGLGPVAASERWTLSSRDATAGLSDAARYLTDGANQALAEGLTPPLCLEFRPGTDATLIVAKAYHTGSRRAGHYQVHALRDPSRTLSPWDLWRQASAGVLRVTAASDEEPGRLPTVEVTAASATRGALDDADRERLSLLLESLVAGRPFLVRASDQPQGERLLAGLFGSVQLLLLGLGESMSFWTVAGLWALVYVASGLPISLNGIGLQELSFSYAYTTLGGASEPSALIVAVLVRVLTALWSLPGAPVLPGIMAGDRGEPVEAEAGAAVE